MSKVADTRFDAVYNASVAAGDLPHVRFGRIDYMNVTYLTTKWNVWRCGPPWTWSVSLLTPHSAPYYVLATDRARTLRFFRAGQMNVDASVLHAFLREQAYLGTPPWRSAFAPGGEREWALERFARASEWVYDRVVLVPRWLFMLVTGTLGTALIQLFHRGEAPDAKAVEEKRRRLLAGQAQAKAREEAAALKAKQEADAATAKASPAKKRKNAKK
jgi:hypothetical protein